MSEQETFNRLVMSEEHISYVKTISIYGSLFYMDWIKDTKPAETSYEIIEDVAECANATLDNMGLDFITITIEDVIEKWFNISMEEYNQEQEE